MLNLSNKIQATRGFCAIIASCLAPLMLACTLAGCQQVPTVRTVTVTKQVPVYTPPHVVVPARPELPISGVTQETPTTEQLQASYASIQILQGYAQELEEIIKALTTPPPKNKK